MVLAAKIFVVREENDLPLLATKLKNFRLEQDLSVEDQGFNLVSEISDLEIAKDSLSGTFSFDTVFTVNQRGKPMPMTRTYQAPFSFDLFEKSLYLTVFEKKSRANGVANEMSKALFMSLGQIVEARIQPDVLKRFHEENFDNTKVIFFDGVDLPNISKLSLYGEVLGNTTLYNDYLTHGQLWYIVFQARKQGYTIGLTRSCIVTSFSRVDLPDFKAFIKREIFPLIG
ncbi:MAG: hypothetical protein JRN09_04550 [Nitrososphaerota archaeon]|nr:hypothetical protein [Nitrososphaerota archaeon]